MFLWRRALRSASNAGGSWGFSSTSVSGAGSGAGPADGSGAGAGIVGLENGALAIVGSV